MIATDEAINPIEWAVLFAALVLSSRLYSLIRASRGVASAHRDVLDGLAQGDLGALERRTKGLGYQNPYGDIAGDLIKAAHREVDDQSRRKEFVARAYELATKRARRRTRQGQITDAVALVVGSIVVLYSRGLLPEGPLFWTSGGAMIAALMATFAARGLLLSNLLTSAEALKNSLLNRAEAPSRPELPSLSEGAHPCLWCRSKTERVPITITTTKTELCGEFEATICMSCGKLVTTLDLEPEIPNKERQQ